MKRRLVKRLLTEHLKQLIVHRRFTLGQTARRISREIYVHPSTIYEFCRRYLARGSRLNPLVETRGRARRTPCNNPVYDS